MTDPARPTVDLSTQTPAARGPRREPPEVPGYRLLAWERIPLGRVSVIGLVSLPVWFVLFAALTGLLGGPSEVEVQFTLSGLVIGLLVCLIGVPVLHEAVHGLVAMLAGARPRYGLGPGYAYTTFDEPVGRGAYLAIGLAPLIVLSVLGVALQLLVPAIIGVTQLALVVNAAGAVGDLWMAWRLRTVPADALIYDLADGFATFVPDHP